VKYELLLSYQKRMGEVINMEKKLYKSNNKMIDGVCAGIGEYFGVDPTLVRLGFVAFSCLGGSGILIYIIGAIIIPRNPEV
jgi:phage shock protein C